MYCRKCLKKGKKVNMAVKVDEQKYVCPKCGNIVEWNNTQEELSITF